MSRTREGRRPAQFVHIVMMLTCLSHARAAVVFVDGRVTACGDGQSWATAYKYLQDALTAARNSGGTVTEVWVATGTYQPDRDCSHPAGTGERTATFTLVDGVALRGGFAGTEDPGTFDLGTRNFTLNQTTLSGDLTANDGPGFANNGENSYHVVVASEVGSGTVLDGFTVSGGNGNGSSSNSFGGGLYASSSSPVVTNCSFVSNSAGAYRAGGGGVYNSNGSPKFTKCAFLRNMAPYRNGGACGGGMHNADGNPTLTRCTFSGNSAPSGVGGGMYNGTGNPTLINCVFDANTARTVGGVDNGGGNITLISCTISGNSADMTNYGVGVHVAQGGSTIANCVLWGNAGPQLAGSAIVTYSCVQGGWSGTGNIDTDPALMCVSAGDFRLRNGSSCIDAGNNDALPADVDTDFAGNARFVDDPETPDTGNPGDPPRAVVDMGAFEYSPVPARTLYVRASAAPNGDGQSWTTAYRHLQDALRVAQNDPSVTEIWVAGGVYKPDTDDAHPDGTRNRGATFLVPGVRIYGGFPGQPGQEGDASVRDPSGYPTTLSGDLAGDDGPNFGNNAENSYHVLITNGVGPKSVLDGFIISGGNADGASPDGSGGGMYNLNGDPTLANCRFEGNCARHGKSGPFPGFGGGMHNEHSSPTLTDCAFRDNKSSTSGAGVSNIMSHPRLVNCVFLSNSAKNRGGGMYNSGSNPVLINCRFSGNMVEDATYGKGGALCDDQSSPTLINCTLTNNRVWNLSNRNGGGIYTESGASPTLTNCVLWGNSGLQIGAYPILFGTASARKCLLQSVSRPTAQVRATLYLRIGDS